MPAHPTTRRGPHPVESTTRPSRVLTIVAFIVRMLALGGGHELAHTLPGAAWCGAWGLHRGASVHRSRLLPLLAWPTWVAYVALGRRLAPLLIGAVLPFVCLVALVLFGLNSLLAVPVLAQPIWWGSPPAVHLFTVCLALSVLPAWRVLGRVPAPSGRA